ncbi:Uncharacterised protein [Achromobacter xylosoxidans]|nr:Uncharacterised protein [Achromobacter xylosoxidans]
MPTRRRPLALAYYRHIPLSRRCHAIRAFDACTARNRPRHVARPLAVAHAAGRRRHAAPEPAGAVQCAVRRPAGRAARRHRCAGARAGPALRGAGVGRPRLLRRTRSARDAQPAVVRLLPGPVPQMQRRDAGPAGPAGAGNRQGPRRGHRGGLPTGRQLRPGGGRGHGAIRRVGHQRRPVLLDAGRGPEPQHRRQTRFRDADHGALHRRRAGARLGPAERRRARAGAGCEGPGPG